MDLGLIRMAFLGQHSCFWVVCKARGTAGENGLCGRNAGVMLTQGVYEQCFGPTWNSFVFPNAAVVLATLSLARSFSSHSWQIGATALAVGVICIWLLVLTTSVVRLVRVGLMRFRVRGVRES